MPRPHRQFVLTGRLFIDQAKESVIVLEDVTHDGIGDAATSDERIENALTPF